jgi:aryl-alcohol dehydrogenase-like predicted oxidoreductase
MTDSLNNDIHFLNNIEMGLGAWSWGDRTMWNYGHGYTDSDIESAFHTSLDAGVKLVDTAEVYGTGRSEHLLGGFLKTSQSPVLVATKFMPFPWRLDRKAMSKALHRSLERLGLKRVDLYQIHWPFPPYPVEIWVEELAKQVKSGLTLTVGVSNFDKNQMQRAYTVLTKYDLPLASNQVEYNLLNRVVEKNGLLDRCKELGIRLIAYSPLAKGFLTGKYTPDNPPPGVRGNGAVGKLKRIQPLIDLMLEIGKGHADKTLAQVALNWVICKGGLPIPGAKTAKQASNNAGAIGWRLTAEEVKALDDSSDAVSK